MYNYVITVYIYIIYKYTYIYTYVSQATKHENVTQAFMLLSSALVEYAEPAFDSARIHHGTLG